MTERDDKPQGRREQPPQGKTVRLAMPEAIKREAAQGLRVSDDWYRAIYEGSPLAMVVWDRRRRVVDWNRKAEEMFGWTREEILGRDFFDFLLPESARPDLAGVVDALLAGHLPSRSTNENLTRRGRKILCAWNNSIQRDSQGEITGVISLAMDITEHRRAENALEQERNLYKDLVASQPSGVYRLRIKAQKPWSESEWVGRVESNYRLEMVSDLFCKILGATREQCEANAAIVVESIHPQDRPGFVSKNVRALETLEPFAWEGRLKVKDKVTWVYFGSVPRRLDDGDVIWTGILLDITEGKRAEAALQESEENQRTLIAALPDVIMRFDADCRHLFASENVKDVTGIPAAAFIGKTHHDLGFPEPMCELWEHAIRQPFLTGKTYETEFDIDGPSGRTTFNWRLTPDMDDTGRVRTVLAVARDITERKRLEAERRELDVRLHQTQRLESLGVLAGGIAHDFNNILMAIMAHAELALDELSPLAPARESLQQVKTAAIRAAELCTQMLAYSGKGRIDKQDFGLSHLVDEMMHMVKTCISKKCVLNLNLEKQLPLMHGDASQIRQVLMNLVINASEAIGDRSGSITVSTGAVDCSEEYLAQSYITQPLAAGLYVYLEVSDTGCGMDRETKQRMFEPFFTTKFTGRGLGLAAVLGIVQAHNGAIRVYSEFGKGTTIKVLLPAAAGAVLGGAGSPAESRWRGRGTVLLVDDEETVRAISGRLLARLGLNVLTADDGQAAVALYRERKDDIDAVLLDLTMPRMNGEEAFRELRQINPRVHVILASGYSESDIAGRFAGKGLAGCLQKPYTLEKLRSLFSSLLPEASPP